MIILHQVRVQAASVMVAAIQLLGLCISGHVDQFWVKARRVLY